MLLLQLSALISLLAAPAHAALFLLAGDSTTAKQSSGGGGWGDGFGKYTLQSGSSFANHGVNGRSTATYRSDGYWTTVLAAAKASARTNQKTYVTIQFGHNDQKNTGFEATFRNNLKRMVQEVKSVGAVPVLVTPLSRRSYANGVVADKLKDWAGYTKQVANETETDVIDLHMESLRYLNAIGESNARRYDLKAGDSTHLNALGSKVFGRLVSDLLVAGVAGVKGVTKPDAVRSQALKDGKVITS